MALISNLTELECLLATSCKANQPADDRYVIVQDIFKGKVFTIGARYRNQQWIGDNSNVVLALSDKAIWFESLLSHS